MDCNVTVISYLIAGRCARAGRPGTAHSLVSGDELCYWLDLLLFLGRSVSLAPSTVPGTLGRIPQHLLDDWLSKILLWHNSLSSLVSFYVVSKFWCNFVTSDYYYSIVFFSINRIL